MTERLTKLVNGERLEMTAEESAAWISKQPTAEERAAKALDKWRETTSVTRGQFCLNLMAAKLLPPSEAAAAARGEWPKTFASALQGLTEEQSAAAQIEWAGAANIRRNAPLLATLQALARVSDEAVDALFGRAD